MQERKRQRDKLREDARRLKEETKRKLRLAAMKERKIWRKVRLEETEEDKAFKLEKWKFDCGICKEKCSYYENKLYQPKGPQFQCDGCCIWGHVECYFGKIKQKRLDELPVCVYI